MKWFALLFGLGFLLLLIGIYAAVYVVISCSEQGVSIFAWFVGIRGCHKCKVKGAKKAMECVEVPDGLMDSCPAWFCLACAEKYLDGISRGVGPISSMARHASGRFKEQENECRS